ATRSTTRSASSTSSITKTLPTQLTTTRRSPAGTEQGWKESDPRAHSDNAQPHHRLPGSNSKTGSLRQESPTSASHPTRFSRMRGRPEGTTKLKSLSRSPQPSDEMPAPGDGSESPDLPTSWHWLEQAAARPSPALLRRCPPTLSCVVR